MEQQNLYLPFLDIIMSKDPETNNIWTFRKTSRSFMLTRISTKFHSRGDSESNKFPHFKFKGLKARTDGNNLAFVTTFSINK